MVVNITKHNKTKKPLDHEIENYTSGRKVNEEKNNTWFYASKL